jgi:hypothetical protein
MIIIKNNIMVEAYINEGDINYLKDRKIFGMWRK